MARLGRSDAKIDFAALANQFEAQYNGAFCGPTSAAIVLNTRHSRSADISPLGAYYAAADSFLVLDVNPAAAGWVWMPAATLVKGMRTFDMVENRGYVLIHAP